MYALALVGYLVGGMGIRVVFYHICPSLVSWFGRQKDEQTI